MRPRNLANRLLKILLLQRHAYNSLQGISQPCMIGFVTWPPFLCYHHLLYVKGGQVTKPIMHGCEIPCKFSLVPRPLFFCFCLVTGLVELHRPFCSTDSQILGVVIIGVNNYV